MAKRSNQIALKIVTDFARTQSNIFYVGMNGSLLNQEVSDNFSDLDVVYGVRSIRDFRCLGKWWAFLGEPLIMQEPEGGDLFPPSLGGDYTYLMQYEDGSRIDLTLTEKTPAEFLAVDSLSKIVLDKTNSGLNHEPNDHDYWLKAPTNQTFFDCCTEFYWLTFYVAKGLSRNQIGYAKEHLDQHMRQMLLLMFGWQVGAEFNYQLNLGKAYGQLPQYLPVEIWQSYLNTYVDSNINQNWHALFLMMDLFETAMVEVAEMHHFEVKINVRKITEKLKQIELA